MMMLWLHLFGTDQAILENSEKYIYLWNGEPLIFAMRKFGRMCVVFYTFLGGYGLAKVYQRCDTYSGSGIISGMNNGRRTMKLFTSYWAVLALFIAVAILLQPGRYPGSANELIQNITAVNCTYNDSLWFLMPYAILTLFASPILKMAHTLRGTKLYLFLIAAYAVKIISYTAKTPFSGWGQMLLTNISNASGLFFMFFVGAVFAHHSLIEQITKSIKLWLSRSFLVRRIHINASLICTILLISLFTARIAVGASTLFDPIFILSMIPIYLCIEKPRWLTSALGNLGKHSTNIWFTHRYILVLSGIAITLFRYPIAIFAALIAACLVCSYIINALKKVLRI